MIARAMMGAGAGPPPGGPGGGRPGPPPPRRGYGGSAPAAAGAAAATAGAAFAAGVLERLEVVGRVLLHVVGRCAARVDPRVAGVDGPGALVLVQRRLGAAGRGRKRQRRGQR